MKRKKITSTVDLTLTPENARERGYTYIQDVINPYHAFAEVLEVASRKKFNFGSSSNKDECGKFGLYRQVDPAKE